MGNGNFSIMEYEVFPQHNKLVLLGKEFRLEPKVMEVLCLLCRHQGKVLSRDDIATTLWPDKVISLEVVTRAIFELRRLLNDDAKSPIFIETIAKKGYCFMSSVEIRPLETPVVKGAKKPWRQLATLLSLLIVIIFAVVLQWPRDEQDVVAKLNIAPTVLTPQNHLVDKPFMSRNGERVLYIKSNGDDAQKKQIVSIEKESLIETYLPLPESNYLYAMWAEGEQQVYYVDCPRSDCIFKQFDQASQQVETIVALPSPLLGMSYHPSSDRVLVNHRLDNSNVFSVLNISNKTLMTIDLPAGEYRTPLFDLDANGFYFVKRDAFIASELHYYDFNTRSSNKISAEFDAVSGIAMATDTLLWVAGKRDGANGIWLYDTQSQRLVAAEQSFNGRFPTDLSASAEQQSLVFELWQRDIDIAVTGLLTLPTGADSTTIDIRATYHPETKSYFWVSNRTGAFELWQYAGQGARKLTNLRADSIKQPVVSIDGRSVAFVEKGRSHPQLMILDVTASKIQHAMAWPYEGQLLAWGPDNKTIYFSSLVDEQYRLSRFNIEDQRVEHLALNAGVFVQYRDKHRFYFNLKNHTVMRENAKGEGDTIADLSGLNAVIAANTIAMDETNVYFVRRQQAKQELVQLELNSSQLKVIEQIPYDAIVTKVGVDTAPYVIYDLLKEDVSQLIHWQISGFPYHTEEQ